MSIPMASEKKKKTKGRQKIPMAKISKESNLLVTFSKCKAGLFKKASELCTLSGAEIAIIVFSPGQKPFSFGDPSVEVVVNHFLSRTPTVRAHSHQSMSVAAKNMFEAHRNAIICGLNEELTNLNDRLEDAKKCGETLNQKKKENQIQYWWGAPIETFQLEQLDQLETTMLALKENVRKEAAKFLIFGTSNNNNINHPSFLGVGSSSNVPGADGWYTNNNNSSLNFGYGCGVNGFM